MYRFKVDEIRFKVIGGERVVEGTRLAKVLENPRRALEESLEAYREAQTHTSKLQPVAAWFNCVRTAVEYDTRRAMIKERNLLLPKEIEEYDNQFERILLEVA